MEDIVIMVVDDDPEMLRSLKRVLGTSYTVHGFNDPQSALDHLQKGAFYPVIVSDYKMPGIDGITFCEAVKTLHPTSVRLMLTGHADLRMAIDAMNKGNIFRFLLKPMDNDILLQTVREAVDNYQQQERLRRGSVLDGLTGLFNHVYILSRLDEEIDSARRYSHPLCVLMLDIDHFKSINDTYGHVAGDEVLTSLSGVMRDSLRSVDILGRYGGEEFLAIMPHTVLTDAVISAERLREAVAATVFPREGLQVTISGGVAELEHEDLVELIEKADSLLYAAKHGGRNRIIAGGVR
jgi:diguanylate cyclase (GGDEF)-like protein